MRTIYELYEDDGPIGVLTFEDGVLTASSDLESLLESMRWHSMSGENGITDGHADPLSPYWAQYAAFSIAKDIAAQVRVSGDQLEPLKSEPGVLY